MAYPSRDPRALEGELRDAVQEEKLTGQDIANEGIKVSKEKAGFIQEGGVDERNCGLCRFYEQGTCEVVEGVITPDDVSNLFEPILSRGNISAMQAQPTSVKRKMYISRVSYDKQSGVRRWFATASGTDRDQYKERMSVPLYKDFIKRIEDREVPPPPYSSDYYKGGLPYLSVAHYLDLGGEGSVGRAEKIWYDDNVLKAKGVFEDTPMAKRAYEAIERDIRNNVPEGERIRISIAFLDYGHEHEGHGIFTRKAVTDRCQLCADGVGDKIYQKGQLIHLALTRIPAYKETSIHIVERNMDEKNLKKLDAASIVGDEFAQHLEEKTEELMVGRSTDGGALVIKNKDEDEEEMMMTEEDKKKKKEEMAEEAQKSLANYGGAKTLEEAEVFLAANPAMVTTPVDVLATVLGNAIGATAEQVEVARSVLSDYQDSLNVKTAESLLAIRQFLEGGQTMTDLVVKVAPDGEATQTEGVEEGATEVQPDAQTQPDALDVALSGFRQRMDEVGKSGASPQDQLMALQEGFEQFVEESALAVKSTVMPGQSNADGGITMADVQRAIRTELAPFLAALQPAAPAPAAQNGIVKRALAPTQDVKVENPVPAEEINRSGGNANQPKSVRDIARASVGLRR